MSWLRRFARENGLSLFFLTIFLAAIVGQAIAGHELYNQQQLEHGEHAVMLATVWLLQRGSPESKEPGREGTESDREQRIGRHAGPESPGWARIGGARTWVFSDSLLIVMSIIFVGSWFAQSVTGWTDLNSDQQAHGEAGVSWWSYVGSATFWEATLENWQSEFLAVGSFATLAVFLRQRGSPESKPVGAPHDATGVEG